MTAPLLLQGTARQLPLKDGSVQCCVCSPPYYGLRSYGIGTEQGEIGLEDTLEAYLAALVAVFREVWRVLRPDGTLWLNIGDSMAAGKMGRGDSATRGAIPEQRPGRHDGYARSPTGPVRQRAAPHGLKPKDLCMVPARLALALQASGWTLRSEIVWAKKNCMPESVQDRPTRSHEMVYLFSKSPRYFFDMESIREPVQPDPRDALWQTARTGKSMVDHAYDAERGRTDTKTQADGWVRMSNPNGRACRSVWAFASEPTPFAHFATFPTALVRRCILAGTSAHGCCAACGAPWRREVARSFRPMTDRTPAKLARASGRKGMDLSRNDALTPRGYTDVTTLGFAPSCACNAAVRPCTVLDPFCGSGTTLLVARELGRQGIGLDLSLPYLRDIARARLGLTDLARWEGRAAPREAVAYTDLPLFQEAL